MNLISKYKNGNMSVELYEDGTKIISTQDDVFKPDFPVSIDLKITNFCANNCPYCHEDSGILGRHAYFNFDEEFIYSLKPGMEVAIGGGNPLAHPELSRLLLFLKLQEVIASITIKQSDFIKHFDYIKNLVESGYLYGVGVSFENFTIEFGNKLKEIPSAVLHVINGVVDVSELLKFEKGTTTVLILGYKELRRGLDYLNNCQEIKENQKEFFRIMPGIIDHFEIVSFDNLALKQLNVRSLVSDEEWEQFYMGDDGELTMYVDLVNNEFASSSISPKRHRLFGTIEDIFKVIQEEIKEEGIY